MASEKMPLTLTIPSELRMLSIARSFIEAACQHAELDKSAVFAVVVAAGEAFTNIVHHAHRDKPGQALQIQCWIDEDAIEVHFLDQGPPFDLDAVPHLEPGEMRIGGRGVYMMRNLMDELSCCARPEGGNILQMVKNRISQASVRNCG